MTAHCVPDIIRERNIPYDPTPFVLGKKIHARVDLANPWRYLLDTSFLPDDVALTPPGLESGPGSVILS
jgi:hypothetical protein